MVLFPACPATAGWTPECSTRPQGMLVRYLREVQHSFRIAVLSVRDVRQYRTTVLASSSRLDRGRMTTHPRAGGIVPVMGMMSQRIPCTPRQGADGAHQFGDNYFFDRNA